MLETVLAVAGVVVALGAGLPRIQHQRRRDIEPDLQFEIYTKTSNGNGTVPRGERIWAVSLRNIAMAPAKDTQICLFTASSVARDRPGQLGLVEAGQTWELMLDQIPASPSEPLSGAAWTRANDGVWYARCVDGRGMRLRSKPTERSVLEAFDLDLPSTAVESCFWSRRVSRP